MLGRRRPIAGTLIALVLACLTPLGVAAVTGLATSPTERDTAETVDPGPDASRPRSGETEERASGVHVAGEVPVGGDAPNTTFVPGSTVPPPPASSDEAAPSPVPGPTPTSPPTGATAPSSPDPTTGATPPPSASPQEEVVALANAARAQAGCPPLRIDDRLTAAAQAHSEDMAARGYFSHNSLDGRAWQQRITAAGYANPGGENIARGQRGAQEVHDSWMSSDGHRRNILDCAFTAVGVGLEPATWTWTQDFGF